MFYSAALDISANEAAFALADKKTQKIIFEVFREMRGRDASLLMPWMLETLGQYSVSLEDIKDWTAGSGPGSFTGLRLVASLISGIVYGRSDARARSIPSAVAMGYAAPSKDGDSIALLMDCRNRELLLYPLINEEGLIKPKGEKIIFSKDTLDISMLRPFKFFAAFKQDTAAVEEIMGVEFSGKILYMKHLPVSRLIFSGTDGEGGKITELSYIRPATFAVPSQIEQRKI